MRISSRITVPGTDQVIELEADTLEELRALEDEALHDVYGEHYEPEAPRRGLTGDDIIASTEPAPDTATEEVAPRRGLFGRILRNP